MYLTWKNRENLTPNLGVLLNLLTEYVMQGYVMLYYVILFSINYIPKSKNSLPVVSRLKYFRIQNF